MSSAPPPIGPQPRPPRRTARAPKARAELAWLFATAASIALVCVGLAAARVWRDPAERSSSSTGTAGDAFRYGSVLFMEPLGNRCRQAQFDNQTWTIQENGTVDCDLAAWQLTIAERQKWSAGRVEAIRDGMMKR